MMRAVILAVCAALAVSRGAMADEAADILAARKFAVPVMGTSCQFETDGDGTPSGENLSYEIKYRTKWQDQDSPDATLTLVQLHCFSAVYNFSSIFVTRDAEGRWSLLAFAEPVLDYDYADEAFTKLKAPPKVSGYAAQHELMNAEYLPDSKSITSSAKWRGVGDAWSAGEWTFADGLFRLRRYEVDPTFEPTDEADEDPDAPESYVVFEAPGK